MSFRNILDLFESETSFLVSQDLPSGRMVDLFEVLIDEVSGEAWLRFRFLAPELGSEDGALSFEATQADFQYLCGTVVLPYMTEHDLRADVVVLSLLDRPIPFGQADQDATQLIEAFRVDTGTCMWEGLW